MPTRAEVEDWSTKKVKKGLRWFPEISDESKAHLIEKMVVLMYHAYAYGFSQGIGAAAEAQRKESTRTNRYGS